MNPPRQIKSTLMLIQRRLQHRLERRARSLPKGLAFNGDGRDTALSCAVSRPPRVSAVGDHDNDLGGKIPRALPASISAAMLEPRPEIRMATRRFIASPRQIEMTVIDHAMLSLGPGSPRPTTRRSLPLRSGCR